MAKGKTIPANHVPSHFISLQRKRRSRLTGRVKRSLLNNLLAFRIFCALINPVSPARNLTLRYVHRNSSCRRLKPEEANEKARRIWDTNAASGINRISFLIGPFICFYGFFSRMGLFWTDSKSAFSRPTIKRVPTLYLWNGNFSEIPPCSPSGPPNPYRPLMIDAGRYVKTLGK